MATIHIDETRPLGRIAPEIYGHFSEHLGRCIYEGIFVKPDSGIPNVNGMRCDVVEALKEIRVPVLRWPGGCFADEYHWKDGVGPLEGRKRMVNTHWGGVVEDNSFGTHEFFELCRQLGCKTYVNGNVGSGTVQEMSEWVEYMTFDGVSPMAQLREANGHKAPWRVDYFGVGNENWGCGGNMTPTYYANLYRRYQTYVRQYRQDAPIRKICGGPNVDDLKWTKKVLKTCFAHPHPEGAHGFMDGLSLHYYVHPGGWQNKGSATDFTEEEWYTTMEKALYMEELIRLHGDVMDKYDPEKKIGLIVDEWGSWYDVEPGTNPGFLYQQNTMRDAVIAAVTLNIFNNHCDRVKMACIAQMVNVLQAVLLTEGEKMVKTPTWHVFRMYRDHQGAQALPVTAEGIGTVGGQRTPAVQASASKMESGEITVTAANLSMTESQTVRLSLKAGRPERASGVLLSGEARAHNTFDNPEAVAERPLSLTLDGDGVELVLPPCGVASVRLG